MVCIGYQWLAGSLNYQVSSVKDAYQNRDLMKNNALFQKELATYEACWYAGMKVYMQVCM